MSDDYDFIIVGAGSAGCVLANKLSANPKTKVLVLEAGGSDNRFWIKTPLGYAKTFADPTVNWGYHAAADAGLNNRAAYWPRGRVLGGSSSINAMAYLRGLPHDFDDWEAAGATGWGWDTVQKTYAAMETHIEQGADGTTTRHGDGPVIVSDLRKNMHPFSQHFLGAARDMGWPLAQTLDDLSDGGVLHLRSTVNGHRRWSSADAYLKPALKRPNLRVITNAMVQRVDLDGPRATGVTFIANGTPQTATARAEVILSAGAINSPHLLQLSGIGAAADLQTHGIDPRHNLPHVGQNLQDHLAVNHYFRANCPTLNSRLGTTLGQCLAGLQYLLTRQGPLSVPINQVSGFVRSSPDRATPDIQIYGNPASYVTRVDGTTAIDRDPGFLLCAQPCRPTSRGAVTLSSADPAHSPIIQPNSLSTNEDCDAVIAASKLLAQLAQTPAIQAVTQSRLDPDITTMTEAEMLENFRNRANTVFHPTSTCRMGADASTSVTDAHCRVHGLQGLRVIDASSFPNVTSGNTNAPVLMLANRAAELILNAH